VTVNATLAELFETMADVMETRKEAVPALKKALEDQAWYVRRAALDALRKIEQASKATP
jgi:HEAT repeat protein